MDMSGEYRIPAPRQQVWEALNDPEVLGKSLPGCESIEKTSDTHMKAVVTAKVGPVKAKFNGEVDLSDIDPPNGYTLTGEGKGGVAGFAKGEAKVRLSDDGDDTILQYDVTAKVGGKLAQVGARLIDSTAKKMADDFFGNFSEIVGGGGEAGASTDAADTAQTPQEQVKAAQPAKSWASPLTIGIIIVVAALVAYAIFS